MKPLALLLGSIGLLLGAAFAHAQARGGFVAGGMPSVGAPARGAVMVAPPMQAPAPRQSVSPAWSGPRAPMLTAPGAPRGVAPGWGSRQFSHGRAFVPPSRNRFVAPFILGAVPFHSHRPWFFHRHPGVVILDVPSSFYGTSVITQYAPGFVPSSTPPSDSEPGGVRTRDAGQLAPFDPTPRDVVERMLTLAGVKQGDVVYDLGSGDGRILIAAAKKYRVSGVGFEIDPGLVKLARENARREGVEKLVEFRQEDFLTADLSPATVVTLYLSEDGNLAVRPQLMHQLKASARVVSYTFDMGDWQPKIAQAYRDAGGNSHQLYLWQMGEPIAFSDQGPEMLRPQPLRSGPLIIDVK